MEISVQEVGQMRKSIKISVPAEELLKKYQEKIKYLRENVHIRGFRVGRVPERVLEHKYAEAIEGEIKNEILHEAFASLEKDHKFKILGEPQFKEESPFQKGVTWSFEFIIDIQPEFELPNYKGLEIKKTEIKISDEEVNERIKLIQRSRGTLEVVEGQPTQEEDTMIGHLNISVGETKLWEKENSNLPVRDTVIYGIQFPKDKLVGKKIGETIEFTATLPQDYEIAEQRGKEAKITYNITEIKRMKLADLNDEFALQLGCTNLQDLNEQVRKQMLIEKQMHYDMQVEEELFERVMNGINITLPSAFIEDRIAHSKEHFEEHAKEKGEVKNVEEEWKKQEEKLRQEWAERMKDFLVVNRIASQENIEVSENDIEHHFQQIASQVRRWPNEIRSQYEKTGMMDEVRYDLRKQKVMELLRTNARFVEATGPTQAEVPTDTKTTTPTEPPKAPENPS